MSASPDLDLLRRLCLASAPPGSEGAVRRIVRDALDGCGAFRADRMGSLLCEIPGRAERPRVLLDAHMDEVGFLVQGVLPSGLLRVVPLGGWWGHVLPGQAVDVLTEGGPVPAVFAAKPPHHLSEDEKKQVQTPDRLWLDVGASDADGVAAAGVRVGDPAAPRSEWLELGVDGRVSCKAFDDRAGVGVLCETARALAGGKAPGTVVACASVQEEVGLRGASTAARVADADVAIVLECSPADDFPGEDVPQAALGRGPQIRLFDPTAIANRKLVRLARRVAEALDIPHQVAVRKSGGTNAGAIHREGRGVPTVVIGVPARYIHTHRAILDAGDYAAAVRLTRELVLRLDADAVDEVNRFDD